MARSTPKIDSSDVPQAPNLARVRCVVAAVGDSAATLEQIADETDISARHVGYSIRAGQALGLIDEARAPTALGRVLLETEQESEEERAVFKQSVTESAILRAIAPTLLSAKPPTKKVLGERIEKLSGLSKATAAHRASDLLAWREQILDEVAAPIAAAPIAAAPIAAPSEAASSEAASSEVASSEAEPSAVESSEAELG